MDGSSEREAEVRTGAPAEPLPVVLFIGEEDERRRRTARVLERRFRVRAASPDAAREVAQEISPDLVVLDCRCPGVRHPARLQALRGDPVFRQRPFLALWPRAAFEPDVESLDPAVDDHLMEPFTSKELLVRADARVRIAQMRRASERALEESEQRFRGLVEEIAQAWWETDTTGHPVGDSPTFRALAGWSPGEWLERGWIEAVHPDEQQDAARRCEEALTTGRPLDMRCRLRREDGSWSWSNVRAAPLRDPTGRVRAWTWMSIDLDERVRHEEAISSDLLDMQRLQRVSARLIPETDPADLLEEILAVAVEMTRADAGTLHLLAEDSDLLQMSVSRGFAREAARGLESLKAGVGHDCARVLQEGRNIQITDLERPETEIGPETGEALREAGVRAFLSTPLVSRSGHLLGVLSTHWLGPHRPAERQLRLMDLLARQTADVVERHRSQVALRQRERRLRELSRSLEARVAERTSELREQAEMLRNLAAELASAEQRERKRLAALLHDGLQQLLVAAKMHLGLARTRSEGARATEGIDLALQRINEAIEASRDLTRELRPPVLYEAGLLPALEWLATESARRHGLRVDLSSASLRTPLSDDAKALLFECARELLFNVSKHAGVSEARVELSEREGCLRLSVVDRGRGFDATTARPGFGLFSIRERIAAFGGTTRVHSRPGEGTQVELQLPIAPASACGEAPAAGGEPADGAGPAEGAIDGRLRVLVVDDHALVRAGIANLVDGDERMVVIGEASDGVEALERIDEEQPEVVLVDVHMPRMNGVETTREIHRRWPGIAVIGLSVEGEEATARSMLEAGAVHFLPKSGDFEHLAAAIVQHAPR